MVKIDVFDIICHRKTITGRADLLLHLNEFGVEGLECLAGLLGFERKENLSEAGSKKNIDLPTAPSAFIKTSDRVILHDVCVPMPDVSFLRVIEHHSLKTDDAILEMPEWTNAEPFTQIVGSRKNNAPPEKPDLAPWARLWPFLKHALGRTCPTKSIDIEKAVKRIAKGLPVQNLPAKQRNTWAPSCQMIVDFNERLFPFYDDFQKLEARIEKMRGLAGFEALISEDGPQGLFRSWKDNEHFFRPYRMPESGTPVFILSDLGCYDKTGKIRKAWKAFGKRLKKNGIRPMALVPVPKRLWDEELAELFLMVSWDRNSIIPKKGLRSLRTSFFPYEKSIDFDHGVDSLLTLLSLAIRVEPALLRSARYLMKHEIADVGTEALIWNHEAVYSSPSVFSFRSSFIEKIRRKFNMIEEDDQKRLFDQVKKYHACLSPAIWAEEAQNFSLFAGLQDPEADEFLERMVASFQTGSYPEEEYLKAWADRMAIRQSSGIWGKNDRVSALWASANKDAIIKGEIELPEGFDISRVTWIFERKAEPVRLTLRQKGTSLILDRQGWDYRNNDVPFEENGSPVATIFSGMESIQVFEKAQDIKKKPYLLKEKDFSLPVKLYGNSEIEITTDFDRIKLDYITRPDWAKGIGRDHKGLFVVLPDDRKAYWTNPSGYKLRRFNQSYGFIRFDEGFWWDEIEHDYWFENMFAEIAEWADVLGVDSYGLYADANIKGLTQRFRWIKPGSFIMGSPETEPERDIEESQHEVIITKAFWIADTACTQELWKSIKGNNPSIFKGSKRPVENVSWHDASEFIYKLNKEKDGFNFRLPTEAEWEYSCRSGSSMTFSFGEYITTEQVNYGGKETIDVKSLPSNELGLFEMHGNVWEWCQDWYRKGKITKPTVDPMEKVPSNMKKIRGGSWADKSDSVRSAASHHDRASNRHMNLGFRLAMSFKKSDYKVKKDNAVHSSNFLLKNNGMVDESFARDVSSSVMKALKDLRIK